VCVSVFQVLVDVPDAGAAFTADFALGLEADPVVATRPG
jgi:hypothetical protein